MKKILILSTILISFLLFSGCDNPSASTVKNDDSSSTEQQKETIDDTHQKDNEKDDEKTIMKTTLTNKMSIISKNDKAHI